MSETSPAERYLDAAQRASAEVIHRYSTSFGAATRLLGRRHRAHVRNIYALVRVADELVDGVATAAGLDPRAQHDALDRYVQETERAVETGFSTDLVIHAFAHTARTAGIDRQLTAPFFASMRADVRADTDPSDTPDPVRHLTPDEHERYVFGSAEVVGLMCLRVFLRDETRSPDELARLERGARQLGAAFQNINFLRDLADDTGRLGRGYLGTAERLDDDAKHSWLRTIEGQLHDAAAVLPLLPADARVAVRCALRLFAALSERLARVPADRLYRERVRLGASRKIGIVTGAVLVSREVGR